MATSPLPSEGPKRGQNCYATAAFLGTPNAKLGEKSKSGRNCCVTPAFLGVPNAKRGEKIRSDYPNLAFAGAQKKAELLHNPCILGDPQRQARGQNQKWLPHPCLLRGRKEGGIAT